MLMSPVCNAAFGADTPCDATNKCPANQYCSSGVCAVCDADWPYANAGSTDISACYKKCDALPAANNLKYKSGTTASYGKDCKPTCGAGGTNCNFDCLNGTQAISEGGSWACGIPDGKTIACNSNDAKNYYGFKADLCLTGVPFTPNGNMTIKGDATYSNGAWDYSQCYCSQDSSALSASDKEGLFGAGGDGSFTCYFNKDGQSLTGGATCGWTVNSCAAGTCIETAGGVCVSAPVGYYALSSDIMCKKCPAAYPTTENTGTTDAKKCFRQFGGVHQAGQGDFRDATGQSFTLQLEDKKIYYDGVNPNKILGLTIK